MKTTIKTLFVLATSIIIGCATGQSLIDQKMAENKTGVFAEYNAGPVPADKSILIIKSILKTHKDTDNLYWFEKKNCPHGKPVYRFLINIDGQSTVWSVKGSLETVPIYDKDGKANRDSHAGVGIEYALDKRILLSPGKHRVFFSFMDEPIYKEIDIVIQKGHEHQIEIKPIYGIHSRLRRWQSFYGEVKSIDIHFDGIHSVD